MNVNMHALIRVGLLAALAMAVVPQFVAAQTTGFRTAGEKITGEAYWPSRATSRYVESARGYSLEYHSYLARVPRPEPAVVQEVSRTLGGYLDESSKHLAAMKKDFAGDKDAVAAVESLEKDLAKAIEHNKAMIACCQEEKFDKAMAMSCCNDLAKQLGKIHEDHAALMKKLAAKHAAPAKK